jgi:hypothetical protein
VLPPAAYAYLLGLYLGDGHVVSTDGSYRLTIKLDAAYPGIVDAAAAAVAAVMPGHSVAVRRHATQRCVAVSTHSILWPQLLPSMARAASTCDRSASALGSSASPSASHARSYAG